MAIHLATQEPMVSAYSAVRMQFPSGLMRLAAASATASQVLYGDFLVDDSRSPFSLEVGLDLEDAGGACAHIKKLIKQ